MDKIIILIIDCIYLNLLFQFASNERSYICFITVIITVIRQHLGAPFYLGPLCNCPVHPCRTDSPGKISFGLYYHVLTTLGAVGDDGTLSSSKMNPLCTDLTCYWSKRISVFRHLCSLVFMDFTTRKLNKYPALSHVYNIFWPSKRCIVSLRARASGTGS